VTRALVVASAFALALSSGALGCSSKETSPDRASPPPNDGGADADAAAQPDPNGGRDDNAASCYASCQNGAFTCQAKGDPSTILTTVEMTPDQAGCSGTLTTAPTTPNEKSVPMTIDCVDGKICVASAPGQPATTCVSGTFSAFSFAFVPSGGSAMNVCTRD
jgi:hypothetical protein